MRSRLLEFYTGTFREEMIMKFGRVIDLKNLECSIVIPKQYSSKDDDKILAACLMEIICGQKAVSVDCNPIWEDPRQMTLTSDERKEANRLRGVMLSESLRSKKSPKSKQKEPPVKISSSDFKRANFATKIKTDLRNVNLFILLDKLREFYLPEAVVSRPTGFKEPEFGSNFETTERRSNNSSILSIRPRSLVKRDFNDIREATSTYILKASDLIKLPDIELHFQALSPLLKGTHESESRIAASISKKGIDMILRPAVSYFSPLAERQKSLTENIDTLNMFNYALSLFFNPTMERPTLVSNQN